MAKGCSIDLTTLLSITAGVLIGLSLPREYNIEGNKVKAGKSIFNDIVEYNGGDKIKYIIDSQDNFKVKVNGKEDTLNYQENFERYNYLRAQVDSINKSKRRFEIKRIR